MRLWAIGFTLSVLVSCVFAKGISPGQLAPAVSMQKWLKGSPVTQLSPDKVYVVEFWATWCGSCIKSMPHLSEVAKANPDVTVIGACIWEDDQSDHIDKFVHEMGDKMNYTVGYSGNHDGMAKTWMDGADQNGIPTAFIVKGGRVEWVGHPMQISEPLSQIKAGTFDVQGFKGQFEKKAEETRYRMTVLADLKAICEGFDKGAEVEAGKQLDDLLAKNPEFHEEVEAIRFGWLAKKDPAAWETKAAAYAQSKDQFKQRLVLSFALRQTEATGNLLEGRKALDLVKRARGCKDMMVLIYENTFYSHANDARAHLETVNQILEILPTSPWKTDVDLKTRIQREKREIEDSLKI